MVLDGWSIVEFGQDGFGELLTEFDTPLIEAVDSPDDPLCEDFMLVEGDQPAERVGRELLVDDGVGRPIAFEQLVRKEVLQSSSLEAIILEFSAGLRFGLAEGKRFGLG